MSKEVLDYFRGDELATQVWLSKYALRNESGKLLDNTPDDMHHRHAKEFARIELNYSNPLSEEYIYSLMKDFKYIIPGGSILFGLGNPYTYSSLGNCFVIGNEADSYGGICKTDEEQVELMKRRGGVGHDISHLRPQYAFVSNSAKSSTGAISFMHRFSNSTREVAQEGRRGALMLSMSINHPDIEEFSTAKDDITKITGANISVRVTDEFMRCVKDNELFPLRFPTDRKDGIFKRDVSAKKLWDKIIHQAWKSAEPGVLFWDKIVNESPADYYPGFKTTSTNPCVSADTVVLTDKGYIKIVDCVHSYQNIWNGKEFTRVFVTFTGYTDKWYNISFSDGTTIKCTANHNFYLKDRNTPINASALLIGDRLQKYNLPIILDKSNSINKDLYTEGFYCGDGSIKRKKSIIDLYGEKQLLIDKLHYKTYNKSQTRDVTRLYFNENYNKEFIPDINFSINSKLSFLAGLIDSDGTQNDKGGSINISSINKYFLQNIKYLLQTLGVTGTLTLMKKACKKSMPNGNGGLSLYNCKNCYRLIISATNVKKLTKLGLKTYRVKLIANPSRDASRFINIKKIEIESVKNEPTYCFNEPKEHKGIFNGILTGQCGEIPLCPYDSCRLLSINLYSFVNNPFTKEASFDFKKLRKISIEAQRLMDDIIDLEEEKILTIIDKITKDPESEEIKLTELTLWKRILKTLKDGRRTGLSGIGLADVFASLGLKFDSQEALNIAKDIYKTIAVSSYKSSVILAKERGAFPIWNLELESKNYFIYKVLVEGDVYQNYKKFGRRNIANLTIPPSGSISILAGISSGIEPVFSLHYKRKRKVDKNHPHITFVDSQGDCWEEYTVYHPKFQEFLRIQEHLMANGIKSSYINPYTDSTAHEINPIARVKLQAEIQQWVDHSISSTINLPNTITESEVSDIYFYAWESGCKGITCYREGCRDGVLSTIQTNSTLDNTESIFYHDAPKRPKILEADLYITSVQGKRFAIIIGLLDNKPYEVFAFEDSVFEENYVKGSTIKIKKGVYQFKSNLITIENLQLASEKKDEIAFTIMTSMLMRHGVKLEFIAKTLDKIPLEITSFGKAIIRILKKYIKDGIKINNTTCPECGSTSLIYSGGCLQCNQCGYSRC